MPTPICISVLMLVLLAGASANDTGFASSFNNDTSTADNHKCVPANSVGCSHDADCCRMSACVFEPPSARRIPRGGTCIDQTPFCIKFNETGCLAGDQHKRFCCSASSEHGKRQLECVKVKEAPSWEPNLGVCEFSTIK